MTPVGAPDEVEREVKLTDALAGGIPERGVVRRSSATVALPISGTDVAMNSAQVTLVKGDLRGIAAARALSSATIANMKQNLGFAFVYNALGIPLAAGVLFPITGWLLSPMIAALAMSLSSASVIFNALRLRNATIGAEAGSGEVLASPGAKKTAMATS